MGTLYERLRQLCVEKGIKGSRMCLDLGLSKSTMSDLKAGRTKSITVETAKKIANYFGVTVGYILGEEEKMPANGEHEIVDMNEVDFAFYNGYKELTEDEQETLRDMVLLMRQRRANKEVK